MGVGERIERKRKDRELVRESDKVGICVYNLFVVNDVVNCMC